MSWRQFKRLLPGQKVQKPQNPTDRVPSVPFVPFGHGSEVPIVVAPPPSAPEDAERQRVVDAIMKVFPGARVIEPLDQLPPGYISTKELIALARSQGIVLQLEYGNLNEKSPGWERGGNLVALLKTRQIEIAAELRAEIEAGTRSLWAEQCKRAGVPARRRGRSNR